MRAGAYVTGAPPRLISDRAVPDPGLIGVTTAATQSCANCDAPCRRKMIKGVMIELPVRA